MLLVVAVAAVCADSKTPEEVLATEFFVIHEDPKGGGDPRLFSHHRFDAALQFVFLPDRRQEIQARAVQHFCAGKKSMSFQTSDLDPAWRTTWRDDTVQLWWMVPEEAAFSYEFYKACSTIIAEDQVKSVKRTQADLRAFSTAIGEIAEVTPPAAALEAGAEYAVGPKGTVDLTNDGFLIGDDGWAEITESMRRKLYGTYAKPDGSLGQLDE